MSPLQLFQRDDSSLLVKVGVMFLFRLCHQLFDGNILSHQIFLICAFSAFGKEDRLHCQKFRLLMADQENSLFF